MSQNNSEIQELLDKCKTLKRLGSIKKHPQYPALVEMTSFLPSTALVSQRLYHITNQVPSIPLCAICGTNPVSWRKEGGGFYSKTCSNKCATADPQRMQAIQATNLEKYGVSVPMHVPHIRQEIKQKWLEKYGVDNPSKNESIKHKIGKSNRQTRNKHLKKQQEVQQMIAEGMTQVEIGQALGISQPRVSILLSLLNVKTQRTGVSNVHKQIFEFISTLTNNVLMNTRKIISPYELDIYVPHLQLAFEIDGIYWHSELAGKDKKYHLDKSDKCAAHGIRLVHIFDTEWIHTKFIVMSRIRNLLSGGSRIFARKCQIQHISCSDADTFIEQNHIQGSRKASINYGLFYENELIAVMTFMKSTTKYEYELVRLCSKINTTVVGGASKLLSCFINDYTPNSILSYADRRWGTGGVYKRLGFTYDGNTPPNYWYFNRAGNTTILHSRVCFQKHKLANKLEMFDPNQTEWENMINNGYDRVWDCGSTRWIWS